MTTWLRELFVGIVVAALVAAGLYWFVAHAGLAVAAGLGWGIGLALTVRIGRLYPAFATGNSWADARWTVLGVLVFVVASFVLASPVVPVEAPLSYGLVALAGGVAMTAYPAGTMAVLERLETDGTGTHGEADATAMADD